MNPLRCPARNGGQRCQLPRLPHRWHRAKSGVATTIWNRNVGRRQTYEVDTPWITWTFLSTDRETRFTGRTRILLTCCVCGRSETVRARIPRWGPVPEPPGGVHPSRLEAKRRHAHPDRGHPMSWALPMRNPAAHSGGLDLDLLAMRLDGDLRGEG